MKEVQYIKIDGVGNKSYYKNKKMTMLHRIDGPAIVNIDGSKQWWVNGKVHRTDGPAYEGVNGYKAWYVDGERHRTDGPAVEFPTGDLSWYIDGKCLTEEQFKATTQPKININGKDFTVEELNHLIGAAKGK